MIKVFSLSQLPAGHMHQVAVGDYDVLLANVAGEVYAIENKCSHYGAPLTKGAMCEHRVRCPWHHAAFDLRTGEQLEAPGIDGVATFTVAVQDDDIMVSEQPTRTNKPTLTDSPLDIPIPSDQHYTYVVVGSGAAAAYAVESIRGNDTTGSLLMVSKEMLPPYDRTKVSKGFMQDDMSKDKLPLRDADFYRKLGVHFMPGTRVQQLDLDAKSLQLPDGSTVTYDKVLLATGGTPRTLDQPGMQLRGVHTVRKAKDALQAREATSQGTKVVIIGSSFIGLESAMSLGKRGGDITVVSPDTTLFERVFGAKVGDYIQRLHEAEGVTFKLGRKTTALSGENRVTGVLLDDGSTLPAEVVIVGIGVTPATDFVQGIAFQNDHSLAVDGHLRVHANEAYAVGDIATYPDREGMVRIEHWKVAAQQGRIAGRNMAGQNEPYRMVPYFWSNQQGTNFRYVGHGTDYNDIVFDGVPGEGPFLAFYVKDDHVQACLGVKRDADTAAINELMALGQLPPVAELKGQDWLELCRQVAKN
ncbi:3-phenylpropionate/cinnamic acid dioxygenase ferredoxin--NAD(+) reductase component [Neolewinella maritima]|uniref:3-phenylpropionate/cinnamic acid dioxygenase ferredoxin--NAD(+) reductase component n=1 Tax=Neolewinella maritima TaxID=1383882 RepID=A0ABM9B0G6_9BACT|nr:FAD-dependent oxidoreductase [Neolewinella maritima]CAH1000127.1 3-phenylpropionate/cinnamic acid dioxygenase ferredoxin--NAD(+) reductase component [Neolewinella maritima]